MIFIVTLTMNHWMDAHPKHVWSNLNDVFQRHHVVFENHFLLQSHQMSKLHRVHIIISIVIYLLRIPELDSICCPSSSSENEQANSKLECHILAPSPGILTFTVVSSSCALISCNYETKLKKLINQGFFKTEVKSAN